MLVSPLPTRVQEVWSRHVCCEFCSRIATQAGQSSLSTSLDPSNCTMQGVMLSHGNLNYQRQNLQYYVQPQAGDRALALLPPWHIYERACAYFLFSTGCQIVYTNIRCASSS